ncbi:hypothetical protein HDU93_006395 [Gonapodya sp. JEL0774]|nr:hypothetical protein HDU93_006395 [Gonapodya sp. JEL0774]
MHNVCSQPSSRKILARASRVSRAWQNAAYYELYAKVEIDCDDARLEKLSRPFEPVRQPLRELVICAECSSEALTSLARKALRHLLDCSLGDTGMEVLVDAITRTHHLQELSLSMKIVNENNVIKKLRLYGNGAGSAGAVELGRVLKVNHTLTELDIAGNGIGPSGIAALADALRYNVQLKCLRLTENAIGCEGGEILARALPFSTGLRVLYIDRNDLEDQVTQKIEQVVQEVGCIKQLVCSSDALAPHISAETISYHYGKHHAGEEYLRVSSRIQLNSVARYGYLFTGYVSKLNELVAIEKTLASKTVEDIIVSRSSVPAAVFNAAAQIYNHDFYWKSLSPVDGNNPGRRPSGELLAAIESSFGSFEAFQKEFTAAAAGHFGSGWAWLVIDKTSEKLKIVQTHDAGTPLEGKRGVLAQRKRVESSMHHVDIHLLPLLTCDVWEHAYYVDYRNARASYIEAWWKLANWDFASARFKSNASEKL